MKKNYTLLIATVLCCVLTTTTLTAQKHTSNDLITKMIEVVKKNSETSNNSTNNRAVAQRLDSIISINSGTPYTRRYFTFDYNKNLTKKELFTYTGTEWEGTEKITYGYDSFNNQTELINYLWNQAINSFENFEKISTSFDADKNITEEISQLWTNATWGNDEKTSYTYTGNNELSTLIYYAWDFTTSTWIKNMKIDNISWNVGGEVPTEYTVYEWTGNSWANLRKYSTVIDANYNLTEELYSNWDGSSWENDSKTINTYDITNNPIELVDQNWNGAAWENNYKYLFTYDQNANETGILYQTWDINNWQDYYQSTSVYDANNSLLENSVKIWNGNSLANNEKNLYSYDSDNNLIENIDQVWTNNSWVNNFKNNYIIDSNYPYDELVIPSDLLQGFNNGLNFNHMITDISSSFWNGSTWSSFYNEDWFYSTQNVNSIKSMNQNRLSVFPNPFENTITFNMLNNTDLLDVNIYAITGQLVLSTSIKANKSLDLSSLNNGVYFYKVNSSTDSFTGKVIKK